MKRRRFMQAVVAAPAATGLFAQQQQAPSVASPAVAGARNAAMEESPKLEIAFPDAAAEPVQRYFNPAQFAALRKLCEILVPAAEGNPGALAAGAPEFLDFLIAESPSERQHLYRDGLDALNAASKKRFNHAFADVDAAQAGTLLAPLRQAWNYEVPGDPLAKFLLAAKLDVRQATINSREFSANNANSGRRFGGGGLYWYPLD